ncbi:MAG: colicin D domain-containing protein [Patescibacteria group bacterium]
MIYFFEEPLRPKFLFARHFLHTSVVKRRLCNNSAGVQAINGTYRGQSVIHYLNPNTGLNVISSPSGQFISGWKLNPVQLKNVLEHGGL